MKHRLLLLITALTLCTGAAITAATHPASATSTYDKQYRDNFRDIPYDANGTVYVTQHGEKYHYHDCQHIKGRQVRKVSVQKAKQAGLALCKTCENKHSK
ncbi:MAG: hypothetical protein MJZ74_08975 [Muribaculaceae bacterium]|nr:hypothetical protein [Muribaculaceae bacterium]